MTAWQEIQLDWALNTEQDLVTGVLLWDLSAAFDTTPVKAVYNDPNQDNTIKAFGLYQLLNRKF